LTEDTDDEFVIFPWTQEEEAAAAEREHQEFVDE
jgi:hypothetical protein